MAEEDGVGKRKMCGRRDWDIDVGLGGEIEWYVGREANLIAGILTYNMERLLIIQGANLLFGALVHSLWVVLFVNSLEVHGLVSRNIC